MQRVVHHKSKQRGFVAVAYAGMIVGIVGFTGLAVDAGYLQYEKRRVQAAADAAAMGALREMELGQTDLTAGGQNDAALNGFTDGQNDTIVTIHNPPTSGTYRGDGQAAEAIVQRRLGTFFMRIFGQNSSTLSSRAVAKAATETQGAIGGCIYALNATVKGALSINGTSMNLNTPCGIVDESSDGSAFTMASGVKLYIKNAQVGVVGGWSINGQASIINSQNQSVNPKTITTSPGDPFISTSEPTVPSGAIQGVNGTSIDKNHMPASNSLSPGVYCGGISISDTVGTLTLNPGLYVMAGGGFTITGGTVTGTGVTIYNTIPSAGGCSSGSSAAEVKINGGTVTLSAPNDNTGPYNCCEGFLVFEDRVHAAAYKGGTFAGNGASTLNGALYFKYSALSFSGSNSSTSYGILAADTVSINGTTNLYNNYGALQAGSNFPAAPHITGGGLVE